jgi:hypothetical protein
LNEQDSKIYRRDAENAEVAQRRRFNSLRFLRVLCASAVSTGLGLRISVEKDMI